METRVPALQRHLVKLKDLSEGFSLAAGFVINIQQMLVVSTQRTDGGRGGRGEMRW